MTQLFLYLGDDNQVRAVNPQDGHSYPLSVVPAPPDLDPYVIKSGDKALRLYVDEPSGDLMVTQISGPNAGKTVNLTYGHWL